jgi:hypothetical protein
MGDHPGGSSVHASQPMSLCRPPAARGERFLAGADRVLRVGGNVVGLIRVVLDGVDAVQAFQAGDTRTAAGDVASGMTLLAVLAVAEFVLPLIADGVGLVLALAAIAIVSWAGPELARGGAE